MARIETSIVVNRPVDEVFAFMSDPQNTPRWAPEVKEVTADGPMRVGARGREVHSFLGRRMGMEWVVTEYEPARKYSFEWVSGPIKAVTAYSLDPVPEGTRVTCRADIEGRGLMRILTPLLVMEAREEDRRNFQRLKQVLEEGQSDELGEAATG